MTSTPHPTWYDVLGVPVDATPDEIKAAWRVATDKFEPGSGSGEFRMFNEAADVLLDPASRAAYDASLAGEPVTDVPLPPSPQPGADPETGPVVGPGTHTDPKAERARERQARREAKRDAKRESKAAAAAAPAKERRQASTRAMVLTGLLALVTVGAVVAAVLLGLQVQRDARVADARDNAPAAAERAAKAIFAYDYRTLPADRKRAEDYLTEDFAEEFGGSFAELEKQKDGSPGLAVQTKSTVTSAVQGSGVVDAEEGVARVLVYVNLTSQRPDRDPQVFQNRVAMKMVLEGDRWLVDQVDTY